MNMTCVYFYSSNTPLKTQVRHYVRKKINYRNLELLRC